MTKIAHLRSSAGILGAERVILELSNNLPTFGFEPLIIALWDEADPYPELLVQGKKQGIKCYAVSCRGKFDFVAIQQLRKICREEGVEILHCHGYKEDIFGLFVKLPKVATNHLWKRSDLLLTIYSYIDALALHFYDRIVAVSVPIYREMLHALLPKSKMRVIANGIDSAPFSIGLSEQQKGEMRAELSLGKEPVLITVSSLTKEKGHKTLLAAMRQLATEDYSVLIVGDGPERYSLEQEAKESLLGQRVNFLGVRNDIAQLLALSDIYILPSYREGLPIAVLEAMAAGKAIIASDVGDVSSALEAGEAGLLVEPGDDVALAKGITALLADSSLRDLLARNARKVIEDKFSARAMTVAYADCYREFLL